MVEVKVGDRIKDATGNDCGSGTVVELLDDPEAFHVLWDDGYDTRVPEPFLQILGLGDFAFEFVEGHGTEWVFEDE